jgi:NtrC-family two-component system response regulator AlgB
VALTAYRWPGNVRELSNAIERAAILCPADRIGLGCLPANLRPGDAEIRIGDPVSLDKVEEFHIRRVLAGSRSLQEAAAVLGIDQATLWRRRKKYGSSIAFARTIRPSIDECNHLPAELS